MRLLHLFCVGLLGLLIHLTPLAGEDFRDHGPYRLGMPFFDFMSTLREELARNPMEMNPKAALYRTHAPLSGFRIWTFVPYYLNPRLTEEFVFNDGRLVGLVTRERLKQSPFQSQDEDESPAKKEKSPGDESREKAVQEYFRTTKGGDELRKENPLAISNDRARLNASGREIQKRLFKRFGEGKTLRSRSEVVFSWRKDGILLTYGLLRSGKNNYLEKTLVIERETETLFSRAGDYRTNLEVEALNNRVFNRPPSAKQDSSWESGNYPYQVGPCNGYEGPLDLFGCTLRLDFKEKKN